MPHHQPNPSLLRFLGRAMLLRCPECGVTRMFKPLRATRTLDDWFWPLDGCPRCGYAYKREPGYFMLAICALNYGVITGAAIIISFALDILWAVPMWVQVAFVFVPMPFLSFLFARHAKALFVAIDHYFEPVHSESQTADFADSAD